MAPSADAPLLSRLVESVVPDLAAARRELERSRKLGISVLTAENSGTVRALAELPRAPGVLYLRGTEPPPAARAFAVVGSRRASALGLRQGFRLGRDLAAAGLTVVSGLARGIDRAALEGALAGGGQAGSVLGNGFPAIYPPENRALAERILAQGGFLLTEFPLDSPPRRSHFPLRNRLISALSTAVVVVEASLRSGSLITARWALEQGRDVFAFPGPVEGPGYEGCHRLIQEGAGLVTGLEDVLVEGGVGLLGRFRTTWREQIDAARSRGARTPDELMKATGLPAPIILREWTEAGPSSPPSPS